MRCNFLHVETLSRCCAPAVRYFMDPTGGPIGSKTCLMALCEFHAGPRDKVSDGLREISLEEYEVLKVHDE